MSPFNYYFAMAKIHNINNLITAASELKARDTRIYVKLLEAAAEQLAQHVAHHSNIRAGEATWEGEDFGGLCVSFYPQNKDQECPQEIDDGDPGGDWELSELDQKNHDGPYVLRHEFDNEPTFVASAALEDHDNMDNDIIMGSKIDPDVRMVLGRVLENFLNRIK